MTRIQKNDNFRSLLRRIRTISEKGTLNDLVQWRKDYNQMVEDGALLKGDAKILFNNEVTAEKNIKRSQRY